MLLFIVAEKTFILVTCIFLILDRVLEVDSLDVGIIFDLLDRYLNAFFSHAAINEIEHSYKGNTQAGPEVNEPPVIE